MDGIERKAWPLLVISFAEGQPITPVQLQKSLFILGEMKPQVKEANYYEFQPYHYGPFCMEIYWDTEELERDGFVNIARSSYRRWPEYIATQEGMGRANELIKEIPEEIHAYLKKVVEWARNLTFSQLVRAVYKAFPSTSEKSVFRSSW